MEPGMVAETVRRLAMALLMLFHIQFAAFIIGIFGLGVTMEFLGIISPGRPHFDRLGHSLARTAVILYSTGAVLAIAFILVISLFWPTFWYIAMRISFWPMVLEAITFVLTILYLFPWYYTWDRLASFKATHVSLGLALVVVANLQQAMVDVMASYMLTPTPPGDLLRVFFNATTLPLDMHRVVGNLSFAGFVVAGYAAVRMLRTEDEERRRYYDWVGNIGLLAGLGFLFLQPAIGLAYVEEIRANSPGAFSVMMRGPLASFFLVQVAFLSTLFFLSVLYMVWQVQKSGRAGSRMLRALLVLVGLSALLLIQPYVIGPSQEHRWVEWVNPLGTMQPWKYIAFGVMTLAGIGALFAYLGSLQRGLRWGRLAAGGRRAQYALLTLALVGSAMMFLMGFIRENSRQPYLIYYELRMRQTEQFPALPAAGPAQVPDAAAGTGR